MPQGHPRSIALSPVTLSFNADGVPASAAYGDVYHSAAGGAAQARQVFLAGNGLPQRWQGRRSFTIVETGFGLGLNFLETWRAFDGDAARPAHLHFVSVEAHPLTAEDLLRVHAARPEHAQRLHALAAAWPLPLKGFHRLHFASSAGRDALVTLTLLFGDATKLLPQLVARADALYLDGFAPAKNPQLWSAPVFNALAAMSSPGTTVATWSVAAMVKDGLAAAGFSVGKRAGFGTKRDMLAGEFRGNGDTAAAKSPPKRDVNSRYAIVIGAGLAGTACAERLAVRGWDVDVLERNAAPAQEASGNPLGLAAPLLNLADGDNARFSRAAFLYALRHFAALDAAGGNSLQMTSQGVLRIARDERDGQRFERLLQELQVPASLARFTDIGEGTRLAGRPVSRAGMWFQDGVTLVPAGVCAANLDRGAARIRVRFNTGATRLEPASRGWQVLDRSGAVVAEAPLIIIANAIDALQFEATRWLRLEAIRGQVTLLPSDAARRVAVSVTGEAHALPLPDGRILIGASFQPGDMERAVRDEDHTSNMARIDAQLPGLCAGLDATTLQGRAAFRTTTPDRLPVFGAVPGGVEGTTEGLYVATGLGARGMVWAPLGAELIAAQIEGEPWPVSRDLARAVDPARFSPP